MASVAAMLAACSEPSLRLKGNLSNVPDGHIYVSLLDSSLRLQVVDTFDIKDGSFDYSGLDLEAPECVALFLDEPKGKQQPRTIALFVDNETVSIEGDALNPEKVEITGSKYSDILKKYQTNVPEMDRMQKISNELRMVGNDIDKRSALMEELNNIRLEQLAYTSRFISENVSNPIGPFVLMNMVNSYSFEQVDSLTGLFERKMPNHKYVKALRANIEVARPEYEAQMRIQVGKEAPDFELVDANGNKVRLSDLRGKIVLVDFWASWCQPCRRNNKTLVEAYDKFASKGFEVLGVSVDVSKDNWLQAIKEDGLKSTQVIDTANIVAATYCVRTIPSSFLLDTDGIIVSRDVAREDLFKNIEKLLK